ISRRPIACSGPSQEVPKCRCRVSLAKGGLAMMDIDVHDQPAVLNPSAELDRLGDEIAELSAHLDAATARLLDLIRAFDARGGWNSGCRSWPRPWPAASCRTPRSER